MAEIVDLAVIVTPTVRSLAYLNAFRSLGICPQEAVLVAGDICRLTEILEEDRHYNYCKNFFDLTLDPHVYLKNGGARIHHTKCTDINSQEMHTILQGLRSKYIIFSGGGILTTQTLKIGKKFIHVHPGIIPEFRGSTCFYYSLLEKFSLGATAFLMAEGIDTGSTITSCQYGINYDLNFNQSQFMDHILDPFIRAMTLKKVLQIFLELNTIPTAPQPMDEHQPYFIIHPLLRHLAIVTIKNNYHSNLPSGIFAK